MDFESQKTVDQALSGLLELLGSAWDTIDHLSEAYGMYFTEAEIDRLKLLDMQRDTLISDLKTQIGKLSGT